MIKFRLYFDKDKETTWLNEMAANGYAMTGFFAGFYTFDKCEPGEYMYQIDLGNRCFSVSNDYREFMEENHIEIVQPWGFWIILRKHAKDGEFQLYTDVDSSIEHYTKIRNMFKIVTIIELICFMVEVICYSVASSDMSQFSMGPFIGMLIIAVFIAVLMKATIHTNQVIIKLKERKGDFSQSNHSKVSPLLLSGMGINCAALGIRDSLSPSLATGISIIAIIFMLLGIWQSKNIFQK